MIVEDLDERLRALGTTLPPEVIDILRATHPPGGNAMCAAHSEGLACCVNLIVEGADEGNG